MGTQPEPRGCVNDGTGFREAAEALGVSADITINDIHHKHKLDAPSGTALALANAVMEGHSQCLEELPADDEGELTFTSVREGEVIGEHTVSFELADEVIEITHKALDRDVFAKGALKAGEWLVGQEAGYYSTGDWLGLNHTISVVSGPPPSSRA